MEKIIFNDERIHFIGIGGSGMSGVARVLLELGFNVSGSDLVESEATKSLDQIGAVIYFGHDPANLKRVDKVVYSTDVPADNVELVAARELGIPILHRSEMLAELMEDKIPITVAGTHGKTTTASMLAWVMDRGRQDPSFVVGSEITGMGVNAQSGVSEYFIAEADESDGSFLNYTPQINIITNIEPDHLENYEGDFSKLFAAYVKFQERVTKDGVTILCYDDANARELMKKVPGNYITYGFSPDADYRPVNVLRQGKFTSFGVYSTEHGVLGGMKINLPGDHNILNTLAVVIAGMKAGLTFDQMTLELANFAGVERRFQFKGEVNGVTVIDDYGHHPTEIMATVDAAKQVGGRIVVAFKPLRYARTFFFLEEFGKAFEDVDEIVVTQIYSPAGDSMHDQVNVHKLIDVIERVTGRPVRYCETTAEAVDYLVSIVKPGDLVITQGAGDIWDVGEQLLSRLDN